VDCKSCTVTLSRCHLVSIGCRCGGCVSWLCLSLAAPHCALLTMWMQKSHHAVVGGASAERLSMLIKRFTLFIYSSHNAATLPLRYLSQSFEPHYGPTATLGCCDHEHTTAFAIASLFLINRRPAHALSAFEELQANKSMWETWLSNTPTQGAWDHRAAAVHAALAMTGTLDEEFSQFYFSWLDAHADNGTGFVCPHEVQPGAHPIVGWMTCYAHISWQCVGSFTNKPALGCFNLTSLS
jgi:hypothetical protein